MTNPPLIVGGNATVYVSDFQAALAFYTEGLGLRLRFRAGNDWAEVVAGTELVIGIHPARPGRPAPGSVGAVQLGLVVTGPMEAALDALVRRGVKLDGPIVRSEQEGFAFACVRDPDGNAIYLWERPRTAPRTRRASAPATGRAPRPKRS